MNYFIILSYSIIGCVLGSIKAIENITTTRMTLKLDKKAYLL